MPASEDPVLPDDVLGADVASWPTGRLLSVAARLVESRFDEFLAGHELTHAGLIALHHLEDGSHTQRQLATLSRVTDQTMSRTLDRLRRTGHITSDTDPDDRRRALARITDQGRRALAAARTEERESTLLLGVVDDYAHFREQLLRIVRVAARP